MENKTISEATFNKLFIEKELEGQMWREKYYKAIRDKNEQEIETLEMEARQVGNVYRAEDELNNFISCFTLEGTTYDEIISKMISVEQLDFVDKVQFNMANGILKIYTKNGYVNGDVITINMLSKSLPWLKFNRDILTTNRIGQCHHGSLVLADNLRFELNMNPTIVTGYASSLAEKSSVLHTWLEVQIKGSPYVLDYTMNILIDKEAYYKMKHIKENETCKIAYEQYMYDKPIIAPLLASKQLKYKQYLYFRNEVMNDLQNEKS